MVALAGHFGELGCSLSSQTIGAGVTATYYFPLEGEGCLAGADTAGSIRDAILKRWYIVPSDSYLSLTAIGYQSVNGTLHWIVGDGTVNGNLNCVNWNTQLWQTTELKDIKNVVLRVHNGHGLDDKYLTALLIYIPKK